jgi:hypothetical protein
MYPFTVTVEGVIPEQGPATLRRAGFEVTGGPDGRYTVSGIEAFSADEAGRKAAAILAAADARAGFTIEESG